MNKVLTLIVLAIGLCGCDTRINVPMPDTPAGQPSADGGRPEYTSLITKTYAYPAEYTEEATRRGRVERIDYTTRDYAEGTGRERTNTAYVYLPYGYDTDGGQRYNVLYLVHGHYGTAATTFEAEDGLQRKVLDHLFENGEAAPTIVVSPSYNYGQPTAGYADADPYCKALPTELVNDLIPLVESRYRTFLDSSDRAGIEASRDHRAIGGFSMGGVTTWYALAETLGCFRYFLPMSGDCWSLGRFAGMNHPQETARYLADIVRQSPYRDAFYIWAASGTSDSAYREILVQIEAMADITDVFGLSRMTFHEKDGARHEFLPTAEYVYNALSFFFPPEHTAQNAPYTRTSRISDVMADTVFGDYGRLIFPVNRGYWSGNTLEELCLTYYNHIDPDMTVEIVNYMHAQAAAGQTIFYNIYTEAEKTADPQKRNTGLFFFRGQNNAPFAVCNAGGAFAYVGAMHDSYPHALELSKHGYNAFALIYRPDAQLACVDLARAVSFIFAHADELGVSTECYSLWGGSAGGRMAAWVSRYGTAAFGGDDLPKAGSAVIQYTGLSDYSRDDVATYACVGNRDGIASWRTMQARLEGLESLGIQTEFHVYDGLPHGFGLGTGTVAEGWTDDAIRFWEKQMLPHKQ